MYLKTWISDLNHLSNEKEKIWCKERIYDRKNMKLNTCPINLFYLLYADASKLQVKIQMTVFILKSWTLFSAKLRLPCKILLHAWKYVTAVGLILVSLFLIVSHFVSQTKCCTWKLLHIDLTLKNLGFFDIK